MKSNKKRVTKHGQQVPKLVTQYPVTHFYPIVNAMTAF
jgi:hypothetical protein